MTKQEFLAAMLYAIRRSFMTTLVVTDVRFGSAETAEKCIEYLDPEKFMEALEEALEYVE
jgi:hypothetical protein